MDSFRSSLLAARARTSTPAERIVRDGQKKEYVQQLWFTITGIIALLALVRLIRFIFSLASPPASPSGSSANEKDDPELPQPSQAKSSTLTRLSSAVASAFRIVAFRWSIPFSRNSVVSITETTFIVGYVVAVLVWTLVDSNDLYSGKPLFYVFWQDRAAHIASCQLPLIVALAGKNNIISFLTGIGHEKLNVLHRAAARACLLLLWMHAICRTAVGLPQKFDYTHGWMRWGAVGLTAFSLATALSLRPIRHAAFEFFLISHIVLICIFLVAGYIHAKNLHHGDYMWPALVIWGLDRALRAARLVYNNRVFSKTQSDYSTATVELLSEDTVRLTLRRRFHWKAGQHAYVILPSISNLPTEAHPFTIANIPGALDGTPGPKDKYVTFLIRGRNGFTGRLRDHAAKDQPGSVTALIDGPYGCPPDLRGYSTCVLVAGGSGVSYTLPLLLDIVHNSRAGKSAVRRVVFIWAVREEEHMLWISKLLIEAMTSAPLSLIIEPQIYITKKKLAMAEVNIVGYTNTSGETTPKEEEPTTPSSDSSVKDPKFLFPTVPGLKTMYHRPDVQKLLQEEISIAAGPVSVDVAGPSALASSVRKALSTDMASPTAVLRGTPAVTLHVETFGMVKG